MTKRVYRREVFSGSEASCSTSCIAVNYGNTGPGVCAPIILFWDNIPNNGQLVTIFYLVDVEFCEKYVSIHHNMSFPDRTYPWSTLTLVMFCV